MLTLPNITICIRGKALWAPWRPPALLERKMEIHTPHNAAPHNAAEMARKYQLDYEPSSIRQCKNHPCHAPVQEHLAGQCTKNTPCNMAFNCLNETQANLYEEHMPTNPRSYSKKGEKQCALRNCILAIIRTRSQCAPWDGAKSPRVPDIVRPTGINCPVLPAVWLCFPQCPGP